MQNMDSKKILLEVLVVVLMFIVIGLFVVKFNKKIIPSIKNYTAYLRSGDTIRFDYYIDCYVDECETPKVSSYTIYNKNTRTLLKEEDLLIKKDLYDVIKLAINTLKNNEITTDNIEIYSDYKDIVSYITKNNFNSGIVLNTKYVAKDNLNDLQFETLGNKKLHVVKFETLSDELLDDIVVQEGETIESPKLKNKDDYKFVGWNFNDKLFDFSTKIFKNITLVSKWEKINNEEDANIVIDNETIDLKDNVSYTLEDVNYNFIKSECSTANSELLYQLFPTLKEEIDSLSQNGQVDSSEFVGYLSGCKTNISKEFVDNLVTLRGVKIKSYNNNELLITGINLENDKYKSLSFSKELVSSIPYVITVDNKTPEIVGTLNEEVCSFYNLKCIR